MSLFHEIKAANGRAIVTVAAGKREDTGRPNEEHLIGRAFENKLGVWREGFRKYAGDTDFVIWTHLPPGSPTQERKPYAFKFYALVEAHKLGYNEILWADSSVLAIRDLQPLWNLINLQGFWLSNNGFDTCGEWTSDAALPILGITREEAFNIPQVCATAFGIRFDSADGRKFFRNFGKYVTDTEAMVGPAANDHFQASTDPRVKGHRWDQSVMGVVAHRMKYPLTQHHAVWQHDGGEDYYHRRAMLRKEY